jgi:hypothetical protein
MRSVPICLLGLIVGLAGLATGESRAGGRRSLGIVPDPSCRTSKLVVPVEQALAENLRAPGVVVDRKEPVKARLLLQYFLTVHTSADQIFVQLDGQIFGNADGKLYAEGSVRSESFAGDDSGQAQAAAQAGLRLGQQLSDVLATSLSRPAKGRKVMLQVSLTGSAVSLRPAVQASLQRALGKLSLRQRGSTERNLVMTLFATDSTKELAAEIEAALGKDPGAKLTWLLQSDSTLMLQVGGTEP